MRVLVRALLLLGLVAPLHGLKHSFITKDDDRTLIGPIGFPFGFLQSGHYNLTVFDFDLTIGKHDHDAGDEGHRRNLAHVMDEIAGVGFLLKRFKDTEVFNQWMEILQSNSSKCSFAPFLQEDDDDNLFADDDDDAYHDYGKVLQADHEGIFLSMKESNRWKPSTPSIAYDFQAEEEGLYFLVYQICWKSEGRRAHIHSQFELDFHFLNYDWRGAETFLSAGDLPLPHVYFYFFLMYSTCLYLWYSNIYAIGQGGSGHFSNPQGSAGRPIVYPIHHLMTALLLVKTLSIFFESIRYHYLRVVGHAEFWSFVYYFFTFLRGSLLFLTILLLGTGWSFLKPFLSSQEKKMLGGVLLLQVVNNFLIAILSQETEGERSFERWTAAFHLFDILCCILVLIVIVWSISGLEKNMEQSNGDHNDKEDDDDVVLEDELEFENEESSSAGRHRDGRILAKLQLFRRFYLLVVAYVYCTRIIVYLFAAMLGYKSLWIKEFVVEGVTLVFYVLVGRMFRPMSENPYLSIRKDDDFDGAVKEVELEMRHN